MSKPVNQEERNKVEVRGLNFSDLLDCFIIGAIESDSMEYSAKEEMLKSYDVNTLYDLNWHDIDPLAVWQNMACNIEKKMGIYPKIQVSKSSDTWGRE